jgi:hypothetical protein
MLLYGWRTLSFSKDVASICAVGPFSVFIPNSDSSLDSRKLQIPRCARDDNKGNHVSGPTGNRHETYRIRRILCLCCGPYAATHEIVLPNVPTYRAGVGLKLAPASRLSCCFEGRDASGWHKQFHLGIIHGSGHRKSPGLQATRGGFVATKVHETAHKSKMCAVIRTLYRSEP